MEITGCSIGLNIGNEFIMEGDTLVNGDDTITIQEMDAEHKTATILDCDGTTARNVRFRYLERLLTDGWSLDTDTDFFEITERPGWERSFDKWQEQERKRRR